MTAARTNPDFVNGVPELLALQLLARRPMYGYELVRAIETSTGQELEFGEGCIYPVLHRLEQQGALESRRESVNGRSRVVYRATPGGRKKLALSTAAWRQVVRAVDQVLRGDVLQGDQDGRPAVA
jgi:PadR family transcriptional regulator, regulatory protein PadR